MDILKLKASDDKLLGKNKTYVVHFTKVPFKYYFPLHTHEKFCEIIYIKSGKLIQRINDKEYSFDKGSLVFIREKDIHSFKSIGVVEFINLIFTIDNLPKIFRENGKTVNIIDKFSNMVQPLSINIPASLQQNIEEDLFNLLVMQGKEYDVLFFFKFLFNILTEYFLPIFVEIDKNKNIPGWMKTCIKEIQGNPDKRYNIKDLIRISDCSQEHITRSFKKHLNITPSNFLNQHRLDYAEKLLINTDYKIIDICFMIGFNNLNYFYKIFSQRHKLSPKQYRLKYKK